MWLANAHLRHQSDIGEQELQRRGRSFHAKAALGHSLEQLPSVAEFVQMEVADRASNHHADILSLSGMPLFRPVRERRLR